MADDCKSHLEIGRIIIVKYLLKYTLNITCTVHYNNPKFLLFYSIYLRATVIKVILIKLPLK